MQIIDGKRIAAQVRAEVKERTEEMAKEFGVRPGLAVVVVGTRPDSQTYVRNKVQASKECGLLSLKHEMQEVRALCVSNV